MIQHKMECSANDSDASPLVRSIPYHVNTALNGKHHCSPGQILGIIMSGLCKSDSYTELCELITEGIPALSSTFIYAL